MLKKYPYYLNQEEIMKKRMGILVLALSLLVSPMNVLAQSQDNSKTIHNYINLILDEVKDKKSEESLSSLKNTLEEVIKNIKPEDAAKILSFVEEKLQNGVLDSKEDIDKAIKEAEEKFDVTLTTEQKELVYSIISKVKNSGIDPMFLVKQAEKIYEKYGKELKEEATKTGEKIKEEAREKIKEEVNKSITNYFSDMVTNVTTFLKGFFKK